uniref:Uncharacterized protein n=1 Tax=Neovison vison TaxID=452646 RepID=A0A8C7ABK6_NEOVI
MREIPRSRLRPPPCSQPQRGPGVLAGGRPNRRGCVPGRAGQMRPSSSLSPKPPHAELCAPGSGKSLAQGGDNIEARAMDRNTGVSAHPSKPPGTGILAVLGSAVKPPGAGSIPSARSPERPSVLWSSGVTVLLWAMAYHPQYFLPLCHHQDLNSFSVNQEQERGKNPPIQLF